MEKRKYTMSDMKEQDLQSAPSLDLPALCVERFYLPKDGGKMMLFFANVSKEWLPEDGCPYCHRKDTLTWSGRSKPRIIRDVVRNNYNVQIVLQSPRMKCTECLQRFTPKIDGIVENASMTERLRGFIKTESFLQPHLTLSERTGLSLQTIQNIMDEEIDRYEKLREEHPLEAPEVLGIDEKHIQQVMRGTIVDVKNGTLLDLLENNEQSTMTNAIKKLTGWDKNIRVVTTDMANRYITWLKELLPDATIVIDKFHVIQDVTSRIAKTKNALYAYRKGLIASIDDEKEKLRQKEILRIVNDNKRLFNYSMENVVRDEKGKRALKLNTVMDEFPEFRLLRMLYFYVEDMYNQDTRQEAEKVWDEWQGILPPPGTKNTKAYQDWCDLYSVDPGCFDAFRGLSSGQFLQYKPYILNYFNPGCRYTNASTEGLNNLIGSINSAGNGYRFRHLRAKALYASLIHERIFYSFDIQTVKAWKPTMYQVTGPYIPDSSRTIRAYVFHETTKECRTRPVNVLEGNPTLPAMLDASLSEESGTLAEIDDSESTIEYAWEEFVPDKRERRIYQFVEEQDEKE